MQISEIYLLNNEVEASQWLVLHRVILQNIGWLRSYELLLVNEENRIRFFIASKYDLSSISSNMPGFILRPVESTEFNPQTISRVRFIRFVTGGNILELSEKYQIKKGLGFKAISFKTRKLLPNFNPIRTRLYFKNTANQILLNKKMLLKLPAHLLNISFKGDTKYVKKEPPKYLNIEKTQYLLNPQPLNEVFEVEGFPYLSRKHYLNIGSFDFDKHSLIVGASGSGKSKLISLLIDRILATGQENNYRIAVVDPHDSLRSELEHIQEKRVFNFAQESSELFPQIDDIQAATELTSQLLKTLLADQANPRLERVLRFSLFALFANKKMDFSNLKRFVTDLEFRNELIKEPSLPINVQQFFQTDFNEIRTQNYSEAIVPIVALVDEVSLMPSMDTAKNKDSLGKSITQQFLTIFSLKKSSTGERLVKTIAGTIIQNIFLLAQAGEFRRKLILIIDEVSVVQNPTLAAILSEARKFNVSLVLTQQYLNQVDKDILDAVFSNTQNYYVFRVSEEDATILEKNIEMTIPDQILQEAKAKGINESTLRARYMVEQDARQVILRLSANGQVHPAIQARTVDASFNVAANVSTQSEQFQIPTINTAEQAASRVSASESKKPEPAMSQFTLKKLDPNTLESSKINPDDPHSMVKGNTRFDDRQEVDMGELNTDIPPEKAVVNQPEDLPPPSPVELIRYFSTNSQFERKDEE